MKLSTWKSLNVATIQDFECQKFTFQVLAQLEILCFVTFWVLEICSNLSFEFCRILSFVTFWDFELVYVLSCILFLKFFSHNLSLWNLSQFEFLSFVHLGVIGFFHNLRFLLCPNLSFRCFLTFWVFEFCLNLSFWILLKLKIFSYTNYFSSQKIWN